MDDAIAGADDLYRESLLDHAQNPRLRGTLADATVRHDGYNEACGDRITLHVRLDQDIVGDLRWEGAGCAVSQASASLLFEHVRGQPVEAVMRMDRETVFGLLGLRLSASRVKCGILPLVTLKDGLRAHEEEQTLPTGPAGGRRS